MNQQTLKSNIHIYIRDEADYWKYYASSVERRNLDCKQKCGWVV